VRWEKVSFAALQTRMQACVPGLPSDAVQPLATALFMCLPLPDAWTKALTHLHRLVDYSDHEQLGEIIVAFQALYDEERDRLWRTRGDLTFKSFRVLKEKSSSTRTRRRLLVFYGIETLRASGLPLENAAGSGAYDVMGQVLQHFWPTEVRRVAKRESIERAYFRGKDEAVSTRFEPGHRARSRTAHDLTDGPPPAEALLMPSRYPTAIEFQTFLSGLYLPDDTVWLPVSDS
jgi:hypothetical protein